MFGMKAALNNRSKEMSISSQKKRCTNSIRGQQFYFPGTNQQYPLKRELLVTNGLGHTPKHTNLLEGTFNYCGQKPEQEHVVVLLSANFRALSSKFWKKYFQIICAALLIAQGTEIYAYQGDQQFATEDNYTSEMAQILWNSTLKSPLFNQLAYKNPNFFHFPNYQRKKVPKEACTS